MSPMKALFSHNLLPVYIAYKSIGSQTNKKIYSRNLLSLGKNNLLYPIPNRKKTTKYMLKNWRSFQVENGV